MQKDLTAETVVAMLAAQGVALDATRAQNYATQLSAVLTGVAPAFQRLVFEEEPAAYAAEQRRNAP